MIHILLFISATPPFVFQVPNLVPTTWLGCNKRFELNSRLLILHWTRYRWCPAKHNTSPSIHTFNKGKPPQIFSFSTLPHPRNALWKIIPLAKVLFDVRQAGYSRQTPQKWVVFNTLLHHLLLPQPNHCPQWCAYPFLSFIYRFTDIHMHH